MGPAGRHRLAETHRAETQRMHIHQHPFRFMSNEDVDLDIYGRTGPFGDALYFGLRDFERVLHDILERTFWPRWNLEEKRDRLLEEVKSARS